MRIKAFNNRVKIYGNRLKYYYPNESKAYVDVIQADVALTATQRLYAHFMIGVDINEMLWILRKVLYLMLGGTASTHRWNAKDLRDLDAAFRLGYQGGINHSANGMQGDGATGAANTFLVPSITHNTTTGATVSFYVNISNTNASGAFGSLDATSLTKFFFIADRPNLLQFLNADFFTSGQFFPAKGAVVMGVKRNVSGYVNQEGRINIDIQPTTGSVNLPNSSFALLARNQSQNTTLSPSTHQNHRICCFSSSDFLTIQQAITDYTKTIFGQKILNRA